MSRFARFLDALHSSRQREAEREIARHAHFLAQAEAYEQARAIESAKRASDARTIADAEATIARATMKLASGSAR